MLETNLSKIGNSMGVLLPKALRQEASLKNDAKIRLESPREGVIVLTAISEDRDRYTTFQDAQARIEARAKTAKPWPKGVSADDLLARGKDSRSDELLSL